LILLSQVVNDDISGGGKRGEFDVVVDVKVEVPTKLYEGAATTTMESPGID
jgi:hypothetical protein